MASITLARVVGVEGLPGLTGAALALAGGIALSGLGVAALALGATALVVAPSLWIARRGAPALPLEAVRIQRAG